MPLINRTATFLALFIALSLLGLVDRSDATNLGLADGNYTVTLDVTNNPNVPNFVGTMSVTAGNVSAWRFVFDGNVFPGNIILQNITCDIDGQIQDQCAGESIGPNNTHPRFFMTTRAGVRNWSYVPIAGPGGGHGIPKYQGTWQATLLLPTPTATPPLTAFPSGNQLFAEVESFLQSHGQEFSPESQSFLVSLVTDLDPFLSNPTLKKAADILSGLIDTNVTITNVILSLSPTNTLTEKLFGITLSLIGPFLPQDTRVIVDGLGAAQDILELGDPITRITGLVSINAFIWGDGFATQLGIFAHDPFDPNYQSVVVPSIPPVVPLPSTGNPHLDAVFANLQGVSMQALIFLQAVNTSFDRYNSALAAGDPISAGLQLEAILHYLSKYDAAIIMAADLWNQLSVSVQNVTYDPNALRSLQGEVAANGFPAAIIDYFGAVGLNATKILSVRTTFLGLDPNKFSGTSFQALSGLSASLFAASTERTFIDIKPGDSVNSINSKSKGKIPVAILSTNIFNAVSEVDHSSLTFGRTGSERSVDFCNPNGEDVNGDGLIDLVCHFETQKTLFKPGDTVGILKGRTRSDIPFLSTDSVKVVPSR